MRDRSMYPEFTIKSLSENGSSVSGDLNRLNQGKEQWINDKYVGAMLCGGVVAFGRWHQEPGVWTFRFDESESHKLQLSCPGCHFEDRATSRFS